MGGAPAALPPKVSRGTAVSRNQTALEVGPVGVLWSGAGSESGHDFRPPGRVGVGGAGRALVHELSLASRRGVRVVVGAAHQAFSEWWGALASAGTLGRYRVQRLCGRCRWATPPFSAVGSDGGVHAWRARRWSDVVVGVKRPWLGPEVGGLKQVLLAPHGLEQVRWGVLRAVLLLAS
eukprot:577662-Alexandrium_andersonii.AAC.1